MKIKKSKILKIIKEEILAETNWIELQRWANNHDWKHFKIEMYFKNSKNQKSPVVYINMKQWKKILADYF